MRKPALALFLSLALCVSLLPAALAADTAFEDVPNGSWFEKGVTTCAQGGVMMGVGEGKFSPDTELTSAECLTLAVRLYDLQRGGEGTLEKAPEDWGKYTLTLADGTTFTRWGEQNSFFSSDHFDPYNDGWGVHPAYVLAPGDTTEEREAWAKAHEGPATFTAEGRTYSGAVVADSNYDGPLLRFACEEEPHSGSLLSNCKPGPDKWYRDAAYTVEKWGLWEADGFSSLLGSISYDSPESSRASRENFARALAVAAGELEKRYDVTAIPDVERREYTESIYRLYESGILNGKDSFGTFLGSQYLTRAECAVMVARVLDESQRLTAPPAAPNAYEQAVIDLRTGLTYYQASERTYETEDCTVFVYDRGGAMHTGNGNITIIYKPGSQPGAGAMVSEESPFTLATYQNGPDKVEFNAEANTLTYAYRIEQDLTGWGEDVPTTKAGIYTFTVDLPTGETTMDYAPFSLGGSAEVLAKGRNYTLERRLDGEGCAVILRWKDLTWTDDTRDYELWLVQGDGSIQKLLLPSTALRYDGYYKPTDRAPDSLELSADGRTLTYTYRFDEALTSGDNVLHEAGSYTYTVDLATGELSVSHTAN